MRISLFLILQFVSLFLFDGISAQNDRDIAETRTVKLDKKSFIKRVVDYQTSPNVWKYLGDKPAIIDFYADWCAPCRKLSPILDELASEYKNEIYVYKVNVDDEKEIAAMFGITSLPTIVFVPMNGTPSVGTGFIPKETLKNAVQEILLNKNDFK